MLTKEQNIQALLNVGDVFPKDSVVFVKIDPSYFTIENKQFFFRIERKQNFVPKRLPI